MRLFLNLSMRTKLLLGFGVMVLIICVISVMSFTSLSKVRSSIHTVVHDEQPTMIALLELNEQLDRTASTLGFYLLSLDLRSKEQYEASLKQVDATIERIMRLPVVNNDPSYLQSLRAIKVSFDKYKSYRSRMLEYATDFNKNFSAMSFSVDNLAPQAGQLQSLLSQMSQTEAEEPFNEKRKPLLIDIANARLTWAVTLQYVRGYLAFRHKNDIDNISLYRSEFHRLIEKIATQKALFNFEQVDIFQQIPIVANKYFENLEKMLKVHGSDQWRMDAYLIRAEIAPLMEGMKKTIGSVIHKQKSNTEEVSNSLIKDLARQHGSIILLAILGAAFALGAAYVLVRTTTRPIMQSVHAMKDIAEGEGDLTQRLKVSSKDEIGQLASAFNIFVAKVQDLVKEAAHSTVRHAEAATHMKTLSQNASTNISNQQAETEQVATSINEMAATVQEISRNTATAADHANEASKKALEGKQVVNETIRTIENLATEVERTAEVLLRLEKDSQNIGAVLDVIRGIADQTNLLALNAAIEAARAGEQGRGFAVVADEVRSLANRTQKSTQEINGMIEHLQNGAKQAVRAMEQSRTVAKSCVSQAGKAGQSLESITESVHKISTLNSQIEVATTQQSDVADEVNRLVTHINHSFQDTAESARALTSSSTMVHDLARGLASLMGTFKV